MRRRSGAGAPATVREALRRGYFPHQLSRLLDNPLRRLLISPARLADRLPLTPASRVLEVGPGSGYFSRELARRVPGGRLELLDLQPEMLAKARARFGAVPPPQVGWTAADACAELPFADDSFDLVLLVAVLGELPDKPAALHQFHRVLKPGGTLAIHEHWPDPDLIPLPALRPLVEASSFGFLRSLGTRRNFTALFEKVRVAAQ
jgi:ubiquinone/menaquinone biosynthesis C-methylase UbiE